MNSSTSSSRKIYLKTLLVVIAGMAISMGIIRLVMILLDGSGDQLMQRVQEARAALPQIVAEDQDLVMAFGSSMTRAGFSARLFDRQMAERGVDVKSFNFGFGGLNPFFQDYLSRRIRESFEDNDRRLDLAIIEFVPFQTTTRRFDRARPAIDSFMTILASPQEIWDITLQDPDRGVRMYNILYFRDKISAEMITSHFAGSFRPQRPRSELPEDEAATQRLEELGEELNKRFEEDYPDYVDSDWSYEWQGAGTIPDERSESTLELFEELYENGRTPHELENDKLNRIFCCDIEELHFEEETVAAFIRIVENFQQFSDHVEVVLYPRNTEWIQYSPEAEARMAKVLERIANETGVTIRNEQLLEGFDGTMFSDTTHLSRYAGDVAYTRHLVEVYAPIVRSR